MAVTCPVCSKKFSKTSNLNRHKSEQHKISEREQKESSVQCALCGRTFKRKHHLQVHLDAVHFAGEKRKCCFCDYATYNKSSLITHIRKRHKETKHTSNSAFDCSICFKKYGTKSSLNHHLKRKHNKIGQQRISIKQCPLCSFVANCAIGRSTDVQLVYNHFKKVHNIKLTTEKVEFQSLEEFLVWKKRIENDSECKFNRCNRGSKKVFKFTCHRSGPYSTKSKGIRKPKRIGSCKINGFCPAAIIAKEKENGNVAVTFLKTHIGHNNDLQHDFLSETGKQDLPSKLAFQIPCTEILNENHQTLVNEHIRENVTEEQNINEIDICEAIEREYPSSIVDPEQDSLSNTSSGISQELTEDEDLEVAIENFSHNFVYLMRTKVTNAEELEAVRNHCKSIEPMLEAMKASSKDKGGHFHADDDEVDS